MSTRTRLSIIALALLCLVFSACIYCTVTNEDEAKLEEAYKFIWDQIKRQTQEEKAKQKPQAEGLSDQIKCDGLKLSQRTYDGTCNNINNPTWGGSMYNFRRDTNPQYADGISAPAKGPNPRELSNRLFEKTGPRPTKNNLSLLQFTMAQFLIHEVMYFKPDPKQPFNIPLPEDDPDYDPNRKKSIPFLRAVADPTTGTSTDNPRQHLNYASTFADGSNIYGTTEERANALRSFQGGKMKTSEDGKYMPYNENNMVDMETGFNPLTGRTDPTTLFAAGDYRANQNFNLLTLHTLFVREHNRLCDVLTEQHPDWDDEQLFQRARLLVGSVMQKILLKEYVPTYSGLGLKLPDFVDDIILRGYDSDINPTISYALDLVYRMHSTQRNVPLVDKCFRKYGEVSLHEMFYNPMLFRNISYEGYLLGLATTPAEEVGAFLDEQLRNIRMPMGPNKDMQPVFDLASLSIGRMHDVGAPGLNAVRESYGLGPHFTWSGFTDGDEEKATIMQEMYGSMSEVDIYVGSLSEGKHILFPNAAFGATTINVLVNSAVRIVAGDRFFYLWDGVLTKDELAMVEETTMASLIQRNTRLTCFNDNVFTLPTSPLGCIPTPPSGVDPEEFCKWD